jgi:hypothetical protein
VIIPSPTLCINIALSDPPPRPSTYLPTYNDRAISFRRHTTRSTTGKANCIVSPALPHSCTLLSPIDWPIQHMDLAGLRPKTYPPQRYLERADLTKFFVFNASIFNHIISMRLGQKPSSLHCNNDLARKLGCLASPLQCLCQLAESQSIWLSFGIIKRAGKGMR